MNPTVLNIAIIALLGFIVGWALEFALDFLYWRRRRTRLPLVPETERGPERAVAGSTSDDDLKALRRALAERDEALLQSRRQSATRGDELSRIELALRDHENTVLHLRQQLDQRETELLHLRSNSTAEELAARQAEIETLRAQLESFQTAAAEARQQLTARTDEVESLRAQLAGTPPPKEMEALWSELAAREAELAETRATLEARLREANEVETYLQERDAENKRLAELLSETNAELDHYRQRELDRLVIEETEYIHEDDLTDIKGVGEVYSELLREAGFYTFRHLADAEVDDLKQALNIPGWRAPRLEAWIEQARELAEEKEQAEE